MAASVFDQEAVQEFIIQRGGRVTNHELVTRFKAALNDPAYRAKNREKFKDYVNTLASIKTDEKGSKVLVLKSKYQPQNVEQRYGSSADQRADNSRAMSEPPNNSKMSGSTDSIDGGGMSKVRSESNITSGNSREGTPDSSMRESASMGTLSVSSVASSTISQSPRGGSQASVSSSADDEINASVISVKDRAKHLNRMETESQLQKAYSHPTHRKKDTRTRNADGDDDDSHSSGSGYVTLEVDEREWLVVCANGEYQEISKMLSKKPSLARIRTVVHWAAKHGNPDILKLVAPKCSGDLNKKSGYTPLHIASMHGHEQIIELLVHTYKADTNIRDYSGKKAKQYLPNSASTKAQQLLLSRRLGSTIVSAKSLDDSFLRSTSFRKSNRAKAISSLIQTTSAGMRKAMLRSTWSGSAENITGEKGHHKGVRSRSPSTTPPSSTDPSPSVPRREFILDREKDLMPPPSAPFRKSKKTWSSSSKESLDEESSKGTEGRYMTISSSEPAKRETSVIERAQSLHSSAGDLVTNRSMDPVPDIVQSSRTREEQVNLEMIDKEILFIPEKVLIPERYNPDSDDEDVTEEEQQRRQEKAEKIKRLLTQQSLHSISQPDVSQIAGNLHQQVENEKVKRAQLLDIGQELARQVKLKTRQAAAERRKTWSGSPSKVSKDTTLTNGFGDQGHDVPLYNGYSDHSKDSWLFI